MSALVAQMDASYHDVGTRGDITAALIILMARDLATRSIFQRENLSNNRRQNGRVAKTAKFLDALVGPKEWRDVLSTRFCAEDHNRNMTQAFEGCFVYIIHFIKIPDLDIVNQGYLLLAISRGAAIICADNEADIDITVPYLVGTLLKRENVGASLYQVKNDRRYTARPNKNLFTLMDPYRCGVFSANTRKPPPVVSVSFALAADDSGVNSASPSKYRSSRTPGQHYDKFTAYDIWCAGAKNNTVPAIRKQDGEHFGTLVGLPRRSIQRLRG